MWAVEFPIVQFGAEEGLFGRIAFKVNSMSLALSKIKRIYALIVWCCLSCKRKWGLARHLPDGGRSRPVKGGMDKPPPARSMLLLHADSI